MRPGTGKTYLDLLSNRAISVLSITHLVRILGRSEAWIFIPVYLSLYRSVPYFYIGFLFFLTAIITIPVSIFGGNLVDRLGRRKVGLMMPPLIALIFFILAAAVFFDWPLYIIMLSFVAVEPLVTVQGTVDNVLVTDLVEESHRNDAFSLLRIAANLGFSIGPAVGGFLAIFNFGIIFLVPALISLIEFALFYLYIQEPRHESSASESFAFPTGDTRFLIICVLLAMIWFVAGQWGTTLTLYWTNFDHLSTSAVGILYGINGLVVVVMQIPTNMLVARFRDSSKIAIGGVLYALSFLGMAFSANFYYLLFLVFFLTIAENVVSPVTYSLIGKLAPAAKRGQYFGAFQVMSGTTLAIAPLMGTYLLGQFTFNELYFWSIVGAIGIVISLSVFAYGKKAIPE